MFVETGVQPEESERLTASGFMIMEIDGKLTFPQPCQFSVGGSCSKYSERPAACRRFECKLLKTYHDGEIDLEAALKKVEEALALRSAVTAHEPLGGQWRERQRLRSELVSAHERPDVYLSMVALDYFLERWFSKPPKDEQSALS